MHLGGGGGEGWGGSGGRSPSNKNLGWGAEPPHVLVPTNTFADVLDNTCDISDFRAHIFFPETTRELPKKQERLNNCQLMPCHKSITDTLDTVKIAYANKQRKGQFGIFLIILIFL